MFVMAKLTVLDANLDLSSEDETFEDFVSYKDRPEWSDVEPVLQDDGPYPVVSIRYSPHFEETFNYFRAILKSNELSERALELTNDCIKLNPSNYTVWHYRRLVIDKLNKYLSQELQYIEAIIFKNQKNYQVWEHYKYVLKRLKAKIDNNEVENLDLKELTKRVKSFIHRVLSKDSKNYHAWQHLQWLIRDWSQWDNELEYTEKLIDDDIRNNSAWNHRFYVIQNTTGFTNDLILVECAYVFNLINKAPHNESSWSYLHGILQKSKNQFDSYPTLMESCEKLYLDSSTRTSYLMSFMVSLFCYKLQTMCQKGPNFSDDYKSIYLRAVEFCDELSTSVDKIRVEYWKYRANDIKEKYPINSV